MKRIDNFCKRNIIKYLFSDKSLIIFLSVCAIVGMIFGVIRIDKKQINNSFGMDFTISFGVVGEDVESSFFEVYARSLSTYFVFIFVIFLLGISVWGYLAVPAVVVYKGYGIGFLSGYLMFLYGFKGFAFYTAVILIGACISTLAVVISGAEAIKMSFNIFRLASPRSNINQRMFSSIQKFLTKLAKMMLILAVSAALDGLMSVLFSRILAEYSV